MNKKENRFVFKIRNHRFKTASKVSKQKRYRLCSKIRFRIKILVKK